MVRADGCVALTDGCRGTETVDCRRGRAPSAAGGGAAHRVPAQLPLTRRVRHPARDGHAASQAQQGARAARPPLHPPTHVHGCLAEERGSAWRGAAGGEPQRRQLRALLRAHQRGHLPVLRRRAHRAGARAAARPPSAGATRGGAGGAGDGGAEGARGGPAGAALRRGAVLLAAQRLLRLGGEPAARRCGNEWPRCSCTCRRWRRAARPPSRAPCRCRAPSSTPSPPAAARYLRAAAARPSACPPPGAPRLALLTASARDRCGRAGRARPARAGLGGAAGEGARGAVLVDDAQRHGGAGPQQPARRLPRPPRRQVVRHQVVAGAQVPAALAPLAVRNHRPGERTPRWRRYMDVALHCTAAPQAGRPAGFDARRLQLRGVRAHDGGGGGHLDLLERSGRAKLRQGADDFVPAGLLRLVGVRHAPRAIAAQEVDEHVEGGHERHDGQQVAHEAEVDALHVLAAHVHDEDVHHVRHVLAGEQPDQLLEDEAQRGHRHRRVARNGRSLLAARHDLLLRREARLRNHTRVVLASSARRARHGDRGTGPPRTMAVRHNGIDGDHQLSNVTQSATAPCVNESRRCGASERRAVRVDTRPTPYHELHKPPRRVELQDARQRWALEVPLDERLGRFWLTGQRHIARDVEHTFLKDAGLAPSARSRSQD
eukprot:scaffold2262_cov312-Prasinococcus_capsulatus_cf.AAC.13